MTNVYWLLVTLVWTATAPLVLVLLTGWRRIRAVTPLALAATLFFGFASLFSTELLIRLLNLGTARSLFLELARLTSVESVPRILFTLASLPMGWLAWSALRRLAVGFEHKRFSEVQLVVDCWWFVVSAVEMATLSTSLGFGAVFGGLAAFTAYRLGVALTRARGGAFPRLPLRGSSSCGCSVTRPEPRRSSTAWRRRGAFTDPCSSSRAWISRCGRPIRRRARLRQRAPGRKVRGDTRGSGRAARTPGPGARSRRPLPRQRGLLPRRHVAADAPSAPRHERQRADGPPQLRPAERRLPLELEQILRRVPTDKVVFVAIGPPTCRCSRSCWARPGRTHRGKGARAAARAARPRAASTATRRASCAC